MLGETDLEERLVQLNQLLQRVEALPDGETMKPVIAAWAADLDPKDIKEHRLLLKTNLPVLETLRKELSICMQEALAKGGNGNSEIRMRANYLIQDYAPHAAEDRHSPSARLENLTLAATGPTGYAAMPAPQAPDLYGILCKLPRVIDQL